jgi:hypothetical protein
VLAIDHGEGRGPLLGEVHDSVRFCGRDQLCERISIGEIDISPFDLAATLLAPALDAPFHRRNRNERRRAALEIPAAANEVVDGDHPVSLAGQVHRLRPPEVAVRTEHDHRFVTHARSS